MPIYNAHWLNANETRAYPIDDAASAVSDAGDRLPSDVLADLNLRWPSTLGRYAFLSAVSVTDALVTMTIQAAEAVDSVGDFAPLAVLTVRRPVTESRAYALVPQADGVGGWVTFGSGANGGTYRGRFSSPVQSRLTSRAARAYRPLPIRGLQALNASRALTGLVTLKAQSPLTLTKEERVVDGALRDCIVVRLVDESGVDGFQVPTEAARITGFKPESVFRQFAGPCAGRPESSTCGCPVPIEFINAVGPDCNGVITVEFRGCATITSIEGGNGLAIDCEIGAVDACLPPQLPNSEGLLPSEYDPANIPVPDDVPPDPGGDSESVNHVALGDLPFLLCFGSGLDPLMNVQTGSWDIVDDGPPEPCTQVVSTSISISDFESSQSATTTTAAGRSVATFEVDESTAYRKATAELKLMAGPTGARHNGGVVINYRSHDTSPSKFVYWLAEVDYDTQQFRLARFNGTSFQAIAPVSVPGIKLGDWYKITVTVVPPSAGHMTLTARLESVTVPEEIDVTVSATVNNFQPETGYFGLATNRAVTRFNYLRIEEQT